MRVYLAGPMTGIPKFNIPEFDETTSLLRSMGHEVVSPAELDGASVRAHLLRSSTGSHADYPANMGWSEYLTRDIDVLMNNGIEAVVVLPGWQDSKGARLETFVAKGIIGMDVLRVKHDPNGPRLVYIPYLALVKAWARKPDLSFHTPVVEE